MAVRFDRPLEGQYATSLWLPRSLSPQAGTKHSLKAPPLHFGRGAQLALGASFSQVARTVLRWAHVPQLPEEDAGGTKRRVER